MNKHNRLSNSDFFFKRTKKRWMFIYIHKRKNSWVKLLGVNFKANITSEI